MGTIKKALFYKYLERVSSQSVTFLVTIILARLLNPLEYGRMSLLLVFINIATVFVQSGLNTALIQKREVDDYDYSSVLLSSLAIALIMYFIIFFSSPLIEHFYNMQYLSRELRFLSLVLFPNAVNSVQLAKISRKMDFNKLFRCSLISSIISGAIAIALALSGYGINALIAEQITAAIVICITCYFVTEHTRLFCFSFNRLHSLFSFGIRMMASSLINTLYNELKSIVIAKRYDAYSLGLYSRAQQFPRLIISNINGTITSVLFPALSRRQENKQSLKDLMRQSIKASSFIIWPLMIGLVVISEPLVRLVLTEKWIGAVPYIRFLCFSQAFMPIHTANLQAVSAMGRSDVYLHLEIIKKINGISILAIVIIFYLSVAVNKNLKNNWEKVNISYIFFVFNRIKK